MATPHIKTEKGSIAEMVLMPGDPLRAKFIAETYLSDVVMFNQVRNMFGYTGYYNGKKVSVMGSGMGMPSIGIYSYELYTEFDVQKIIRIGSCGAYVPELELFDIVLVDNAYSDSSYAYVQSGNEDKTISSSLNLTNHIEDIALKEVIKVTRGTIYSTDVFYNERLNFTELVTEQNCLGVEMESFALFQNAKILNKEAACILTVSDSFITKEVTTSDQREKSFINMVELALKTL
ncbi:MAG: purine-nucleoside phosphorylase [Bacilli bacterium]|nr:purine-nucleoside phosphorylase [Bacilli bacterium]MDD3304615.1 purine-nucleoside phosphorylase [Bacilli bacterium]MDD4053528.1 purine-nucleoside phosphorylase [Bacilli bacterium]MDD4411505.1 purine-nucleoside phosphorylase [Bacilli bacterium]